MSMHSPVVIGLAGKARAGKDTVAQAFDEVIPPTYRVNSYAFADRLRGALLALDPIVGCDAFGFDRLSAVLEDYEGWEGVKDSMYGPEIRRLLQRLGTESIRSLDNDFWVRQLVNDIYRKETTFRAVENIHVIRDVRFENEAAMVKTFMRGVVVRVVNEEDDTALTHVSEDINFDTDFTIYNRPSEGYQKLRSKVEDLWTEIEEGVIK